MCVQTTFSTEYRGCGHRIAQAFIDKYGLPKKAEKRGDEICPGVSSEPYGRGGTQRVDGLCPPCTRTKSKAEKQAQKTAKTNKGAPGQTA